MDARYCCCQKEKRVDDFCVYGLHLAVRHPSTNFERLLVDAEQSCKSRNQYNRSRASLLACLWIRSKYCEQGH